MQIAKMLLEAGAEPDALANMYGGECTTMSMLVSSCHPFKDTIWQGTPLGWAEHGGREEVAAYLREQR